MSGLRRRRKRRAEDTSGMTEAQAAIEQAKKNLADAHAQQEEARSIADKLREIRTQNRFAERVRDALGEG